MARLHNDLTLTALHFRITGVYLLCVMFTIVYMEHVTSINQPLALLISFTVVMKVWVKVSVFASKF